MIRKDMSLKDVVKEIEDFIDEDPYGTNDAKDEGMDEDLYNDLYNITDAYDTIEKAVKAYNGYMGKLNAKKQLEDIGTNNTNE